MSKYTALAITTNYWRPHSVYNDKIVAAIAGKVEEGDFVVVSEKAISTALGCMVDESTVKPSVRRGFWRVSGCGLSGVTRLGYCVVLDRDC